jgi:molecular chaperone HscB
VTDNCRLTPVACRLTPTFDHMNYFELFYLPVSLNVDKQQLSKNYFELQKQYHPDFHANALQEEQADVLERSSMINKAYKTFLNQDSTIKYVLTLKGLLEEEEKYQLPADFLMEMMEINESIDEATDVDAKRKIIDQQVEQLYDEVKPIINNYEDGVTPAADLQKVKEYYFKKKYLRRILDRLDSLE